MKISIFISSYKLLNRDKSFRNSFLEFMNQVYSSEYHKELVQNNSTELDILQKHCENDNLENIIPKQFTLDNDFALNLNLLDSINCSCLTEITTLGKIIKSIMIDNYQLVLTQRNWVETNQLTLYFEAVDYGDAGFFISKAINQ
jgi:hypothetical protein